MRWDFGFTCPFCLLHESDLADATGQSQGMGVTWVEHRWIQSGHPDERSRYENCLYSCRYCNRARGTTPVIDEARGRRLLDPTQVAWADHFHLDGDRMAYRADDADAHYTHETYGIDDERKVTLRAERAERIDECLETLRDAPRRIETLLSIAQSPALSAAERGEILDEAGRIRTNIRRAQKDLTRRAPIPSDACHSCRCRSTEHHELPAALAAQVLELDAS